MNDCLAVWMRVMQTGPVPAPSGSHWAAEGDGGSSSGPPPDQRAAVSGQHPVHAARSWTLRASDHRHAHRPNTHGMSHTYWVSSNTVLISILEDTEGSCFARLYKKKKNTIPFVFPLFFCAELQCGGLVGHWENSPLKRLNPLKIPTLFMWLRLLKPHIGFSLTLEWGLWISSLITDTETNH